MNELHPLITSIPLDGIVRVDLGLEGDWSGSVVTVWSRAKGLLGFEAAVRRHPEHTPSLELYFEGGWVGAHCHLVERGENVFDENRARRVIGFVEQSLAGGERG